MQIIKTSLSTGVIYRLSFLSIRQRLSRWRLIRSRNTIVERTEEIPSATGSAKKAAFAPKKEGRTAALITKRDFLVTESASPVFGHSRAVSPSTKTYWNRNLWMNPLSKVMGGWGIWETVNGEQKLTTECIENVIMMVPFSSVVMWTFKEKTGNGWKKILWYSGKIAFIFSVSIEMLQLLLRLGTFQLSDIFYNTVGGMLGGLVYYVTMKARKHL